MSLPAVFSVWKLLVASRETRIVRAAWVLLSGCLR